MKGIFTALLALLTLGTANAQNWPSRPLRYIVPFPPGAFNDTLARTLSAELPKSLGQPVIVENRPGGNTIIGTEGSGEVAARRLYAFRRSAAVLRDPEPVQDFL